MARHKKDESRQQCPSAPEAALLPRGSRIRSRSSAIKKAQTIVKGAVRKGVRLVDELIADRRVQASREGLRRSEGVRFPLSRSRRKTAPIGWPRVAVEQIR
jgi:hypothetical protein